MPFAGKEVIFVFKNFLCSLNTVKNCKLLAKVKITMLLNQIIDYSNGEYVFNCFTMIELNL